MAALLAGSVVAVGATGTAHASAAPQPWLPATPANWSLVVDQTKTPPTTVTRGVTQYSETYDTVGGRQHTQVLDVNLADPNVRLGVVEAGDVITNPADETVSSMAGRTHAVAGVNGDFFEINASGRPLGGVITNGKLLKSPRPNFNAQLGVRADGTMVLGPQSFTGSITDGATSTKLTSVNVLNDVATGGITELTPDLGGATSLPAGTLVLGHETKPGTLVVDSVQTGVTAAPALPTGRLGLLGGGAGAAWLSGTVHVGDSVTVATDTGGLRQLLSGSTMLVKDGAVYDDPTGNPPGGVNPETVVGVSKDGKRTIIATLDGRLGASTAVGVSPAQVAGYMVAHGAYNAVLFDGGGSTEMVARKPGDPAVSVMNSPSDGHERPVANGLFLYSTEQAPGLARSAVLNGGQGVDTVPGATVPVPAYGLDSLGNPAREKASVQVVPSTLGSWHDGQFTAGRAGVGVLIARAGIAVSVQPLRVVDRLGSLRVSPADPDLNNGGTQTFTLSGSTSTGTAVAIPAAAATWSVSDPALGGVDGSGVFTAAATGSGVEKVTAKVGGATATATVAIGSVSQELDDFSDPTAWNLRNTTGQPVTMVAAPGVVPPGSTAAASTQLTYTMPAGSGVKQLVLSPKSTITAGANADGQNPTGIGVWVKGDGTGIQLAESYLGIDGATTTLYPTTVTWKDWRLAIATLPPGLNFPLRISFVDFLTINPSQTTSGTLNVSGLQALYSPRPPVTPPYQAIPQNPSWLKFSENAADFSRSGSTMLLGDDAHLVASDPGSASSNVMDAIKARLPQLPAQARPSSVQTLGDMSDDGQPADLQYAQSKIAALGLPYHDVVGNHEISQGSLPENGNFAQVFGNTHYAYQAVDAQVIVTDNSHGSLQSADAFQVPAEPQYPWLVKQLTDTTSPTVLVTTHMPAYDPHPVANSQFSDWWEARMYVRLVQRYQQTHPDKHVVMLYGHARGFADQVIDPLGNPSTPAAGGIPQLTIADLGMPAYAPSDEGGIYHFVLLHTARGDVQFSVEPVLSSIAVTVPALRAGASGTASAIGAEVGGDNLPATTMPIADPASHVWSSSDPKVATVDAKTGRITARRAGPVTISVASGGVTGSAQLTVMH
ncbi:phosphodiester glycosidase family protein [Amycolatopsis sp. FDAARGOS 1241]|uniref:phosphodiester glycosidase family protein n=1 Tax=Amycolatopsis sp. FDAARGOS 1241 TaxID=2778070 RepID=UPI0019509154|nr:phosphodiester glycosidase family protein [Amycolatopsis sp. FDAARGOS 1241]QRP45654.1 phosphodiester glycosidase family protein [Amycolatopsis sp. FDAARGOS 1241]